DVVCAEPDADRRRGHETARGNHVAIGRVWAADLIVAAGIDQDGGAVAPLVSQATGVSADKVPRDRVVVGGFKGPDGAESKGSLVHVRDRQAAHRRVVAGENE